MARGLPLNDLPIEAMLEEKRKWAKDLEVDAEAAAANKFVSGQRSA